MATFPMSTYNIRDNPNVKPRILGTRVDLNTTYDTKRARGKNCLAVSAFRHTNTDTMLYYHQQDATRT